jgi:hypothetical protein
MCNDVITLNDDQRDAQAGTAAQRAHQMPQALRLGKPQRVLVAKTPQAMDRKFAYMFQDRQTFACVFCDRQ